MKKILIILLVQLLFSCANSQTQNKCVEEGFLNIEKSRIGKFNIYLYTIDSCEYLGRLGNYLEHKGNCKNPIHKK